jgi:hypothetical protein
MRWPADKPRPPTRDAVVAEDSQLLLTSVDGPNAKCRSGREMSAVGRRPDLGGHHEADAKHEPDLLRATSIRSPVRAPLKQPKQVKDSGQLTPPIACLRF